MNGGRYCQASEVRSGFLSAGGGKALFSKQVLQYLGFYLCQLRPRDHHPWLWIVSSIRQAHPIVPRSIDLGTTT